MRRRTCCTVVTGVISTKPTIGQPSLRTRPYGIHDTSPSSGTCCSITETGAFALKRLRLNRPPLVAYRVRKQGEIAESRLRTRYRDLVVILEQLHQQQVALLEEQQVLIEEQRRLVQLLLQQ